MILDPIALMPQIIAVLAVTISVVALAYEVRQNTRAIRTSSYNAMVSNSIELARAIYENPALAMIFSKAERDPSLLDEIELQQWHAFLLAGFRHWDNLYYQAARKNLEPELWESYDNTISTVLGSPGVAEWFQLNRDLFTQSLQRFVASKSRPPASA